MAKNSLIYLLIFTLMLVSLGCGLTVNLPVDKITTGPVRSETIKISAPAVETVDVKLIFGAGELSLTPGSGNELISGEASYNVDDFKPKITIESNLVKMETGHLEISGIPDVQGAESVKNIWDLALGKQPMNLTIQAGAYKGNYELGGLAIKSLDIGDGAAETNLTFSSANLLPMDTFRYTTGASNVSLSGLGYANFTSMIFRSGAGNYTLDFGGGLQRDAVVTVEAGMSEVTINVPPGVNAKVFFKGGLTTVNTSGGWQKSGDQYLLAGSGPTLTINVDLGAGDLKLMSTGG